MKTTRSSSTPLYLTAFFVLGFALSSPLTATQPEQVERFGHFIYTGSLNVGRFLHTATLLPDGKVLAVGGLTVTAELYDPATGMWSFTGQTSEKRLGHTATLLLDGRVLIAGGSFAGLPLRTAEVYDPATGTWSATGSMNERVRTTPKLCFPTDEYL